MTRKAASTYGACIRLVCPAFGISGTCYRYQAKLSDGNAEIADWLV
jgi:putative transposase